MSGERREGGERRNGRCGGSRRERRRRGPTCGEGAEFIWGKRAGLKAGLINAINNRDFGKIEIFGFWKILGFLEKLEIMN